MALIPAVTGAITTNHAKMDKWITLSLVLSYNAGAPFHGSHGAYSLSSKLAYARRLEDSGHIFREKGSQPASCGSR